MEFQCDSPDAMAHAGGDRAFDDRRRDSRRSEIRAILSETGLPADAGGLLERLLDGPEVHR